MKHLGKLVCVAALLCAFAFAVVTASERSVDRCKLCKSGCKSIKSNIAKCRAICELRVCSSSQSDSDSEFKIGRIGRRIGRIVEKGAKIYGKYKQYKQFLPVSDAEIPNNKTIVRKSPCQTCKEAGNSDFCQKYVCQDFLRRYQHPAGRWPIKRKEKFPKKFKFSRPLSDSDVPMCTYCGKPASCRNGRRCPAICIPRLAPCPTNKKAAALADSEMIRHPTPKCGVCHKKCAQNYDAKKPELWASCRKQCSAVCKFSRPLSDSERSNRFCRKPASCGKGRKCPAVCLMDLALADEEVKKSPRKRLLAKKGDKKRAGKRSGKKLRRNGKKGDKKRAHVHGKKCNKKHGKRTDKKRAGKRSGKKLRRNDKKPVKGRFGKKLAAFLRKHGLRMGTKPKKYVE